MHVKPPFTQTCILEILMTFLCFFIIIVVLKLSKKQFLRFSFFYILKCELYSQYISKDLTSG